ncbi:alpha/beta hydrolase [Pseudaestuariivita atlantica]|uniref:Esterase n=1 Tax=Pseudaestuariivita atlantica TaxID=1317121 RepID=A0A0L1JQJ1_9RHOB|nr:alpha/beta fold hydrolase [Pseudaestuariivita atlantica]KNG94000.1 hypothetical protein ATO11_06980 [Pseudaestuariivita atlantica]
MKRRAFLSASTAALAAGCAPNEIVRTLAPDMATTQIERVHLVAARELGATDPLFGQKRVPGLHFGWADVSIPPVHALGEIEWPRPKETPDPALHFLMADQKVLPSMASLDATLSAAPGGNERLLFVHGYNTRLPGLIYRVAQMSADFRPPHPLTAFAWPSGGDGRAYLYDRDSAIFARDDLETTLQGLTRTGKVTLLAHSLGGFLTMEALRGLAKKGDRRTLSRINGVVLMSPDIDPDVFRRQAEAIGTLPQPFFLFVGQRDRALRLSSFLRGSKPQLGLIDSAEAVAGLPVTVIDFTNLSEGEDFDHFVPITSPSAIRQLRGLFDLLEQGNAGFDRFVQLGERGPT